MSAQGWGSQEAYEKIHGTQKEQARRQVSQVAVADGPWKLEREIGRDNFGKPKFVILTNSVRSTSFEANRLIEEERGRTGLEWTMVRV
jgi:hypothetical protein